MRPLAIILTCPLTALLVGCSHQTLPAREFRVSFDPQSGAPAILIVEQVEQSGGGDCPPSDPEKLLHASAVSDAGGRVDIAKPETHSDVWSLGLRRREQYARWTVFRPGSVVTTIYPEGRDISDSGVPVEARLSPRIGWCRPPVGGGWHAELGPDQKLDVSFARDDRVVGIVVPLRSIPKAGKPLEPDPRWQNGPVVPPLDTLCKSDAATLDWQIRQLISLRQQGELKQLSTAWREIIVSAIGRETSALQAGGLDGERCAELNQLVSELHKSLATSDSDS